MFRLKFTGTFNLSCSYMIAAEQKARVTYDNILRLCDDPDVRDPIKFLREREIVHYQRFADALRITQEGLDGRNFYACNPAYDTGCAVQSRGGQSGCRGGCSGR